MTFQREVGGCPALKNAHRLFECHLSLHSLLASVFCPSVWNTRVISYRQKNGRNLGYTNVSKGYFRSCICAGEWEKCLQVEQKEYGFRMLVSSSSKPSTEEGKNSIIVRQDIRFRKRMYLHDRNGGCRHSAVDSTLEAIGMGGGEICCRWFGGEASQGVRGWSNIGLTRGSCDMLYLSNTKNSSHDSFHSIQPTFVKRLLDS